MMTPKKLASIAAVIVTLAALTSCAPPVEEDTSVDSEFDDEYYDAYEELHSQDADQIIDAEWRQIIIPEWGGDIFITCYGVHGIYILDDETKLIIENDPECVR